MVETRQHGAEYFLGGGSLVYSQEAERPMHGHPWRDLGPAVNLFAYF